ncbi:MAG: alpha-amylase family glycosyl hydrolase [Candidatus Cloacimonadales bacterium]
MKDISNPKLSMKKGIPLHKQNIDLFVLKRFQLEDKSLLLSNDQQSQELVHLLQSKEEFAGISFGELFGLNLIVQAYRQILGQFLQNMSSQQQQEILDLVNDFLDTQEQEKLKTKLEQDFQVQGNEQFIESVIIWLCNENPAFHPYKSLFADDSLRTETQYLKLIKLLQEYFSQQPALTQDYSLFDLLLLPAQKHPDSIYEQLSFLRSNFGTFLGESVWTILMGLDVMQEERAYRGGAPGPAQVYDFSSQQEEYESFTADSSWMSSLVLMAKSTYVWLAQLSRKYQREITSLDDIPDAELDQIARRGINGIWLIGIWERSHASRKFKQLKGNPEALASAYSLKNYHVAQQLGGDAGMRKLQRKAWRHGIRIGCDMVPNHLGIDSDWIIEHPDWFLQTAEPPFPAYQFQSQNLTDRSEIEVVVEDHYYEESDAAVVYKLHDKRDGRTRYIYHGNDGTSIPWNDTAQLNFLLADMREALIQEIVKIAHDYPIIRFDAAMTLAKRHLQRLWFPPRGSAGDIPSRARFALSKEEFDRLLPKEFWREVVDRVRAEAPNTLLLAEAFWMMEGYFVRTLGMHRVYNSAFMNMLKAEENSKYRKSIKSVLAFNPQILKRFVNFMSNPDEETTIAQFGADDKYFGVCVLLATMPGLPMFAHGQLEGFSERYGMEYARPRRWEAVDETLLKRHEREIFQLLRARELFAEVDDFLLYDFRTSAGKLDENVFAYSNQLDDKKVLVVFHNSYAETSGYVDHAPQPSATLQESKWAQISLAEAWHLHPQENFFTIFTDAISGLTYLRRSSDLSQNGLYLKLGAFKYAVYWDVWEIEDISGNFAGLYNLLDGKGTKNLNHELKRLELCEMLDAWQKLISPIFLKQIIFNWKHLIPDFITDLQPELRDRLKKQITNLLDVTGKKSEKDYAALISQNLQNVFKIESELVEENEAIALMIAMILQPLSEIWADDYTIDWFRAALISDEIELSLQETDAQLPAQEIVLLAGALIELMNSWEKVELSGEWLKDLFCQPEIRKFLNIHKYDEISWFSQDSYQTLWRLAELIVPWQSKQRIAVRTKFIKKMQELGSASEFQTEKLFTLVKKEMEA